MGAGIARGGWLQWPGGGGGSGSGRGVGGAPSILQSPKFRNPAVFLEDFNATSIDTAQTAGHPKWIITATGTGTAGIISGGAAGTPGQGATTAYYGTLGITNGGVDDELTLVETAVGTNGHSIAFSGSSGFRFLFAARISPGASTTSIAHGIALLPPSVAIGTDWINDPATTLANINALILYKDTDAATTYSVNGYYSGGSFTNVIGATQAANTYRSYELYSDSANLYGYAAGVLAFTQALPAAWNSTFGWRISIANKNRSGAARTTTVDYVYSETEFAVSR